METRAARDRRSDAASAQRNPSSSGIVLWRPDVVIATSLQAAIDGSSAGVRVPRPSVTLAQPLHRPERVKARIEATRSILSSLAEARRTLDAGVATPGFDSVSERDRVSATIETYRAEAALDDVLRTASRHVTTLMKERGLR
jgi:hypothetical protein